MAQADRIEKWAKAVGAVEATVLLNQSSRSDCYSPRASVERGLDGESICRTESPAKRGRRPVAVTQADIERAIKAAQKRKAASVVLPNGVRIDLSKAPEEKPPPELKVIL